jgi:hypothetical protein
MGNADSPKTFPPEVWEELHGLYEEFIETHKSTVRTFELLRLTGLDCLAAELGREAAARFPEKNFDDIDAMVKEKVRQVIARNFAAG